MYATLQADEDMKMGVRQLQAQHVLGRLSRLEEEFRRVQELMGFAELDSVVERIQAQQQAGMRMTQLKADVMAKHESLLALKARLDCVYEEQLEGVDSELNQRRYE